jgi:aminoglycoside 6'-N-acetyltransferase I
VGQIRAATADDIGVLVELARAFYDEDGFTTGNEELRQNFTVLVPADNAHLVLATEDDVAVGFALTTTAFILESGLVAELQDLYVTPEARAGGTGSALIEDAVQWAHARAATMLEVVVAPNGRDVAHLFGYYRRRGFVDEGRRVLARRLS